MLVRKTFATLIIFSSLVFATPVLAGGGPVSFNVSPSGPIRPGQQYIVRPTVQGSTPDSKCQKCTITIKFENPQSGDVINQSDSKTDDNGTMYAKVISQAIGERIIFAEVTDPTDGATYQSSRYVLYFREDPVPSGNITAKVTGQKSLGGNVRQVSLGWTGSSDQVVYYVFAKPANASYGAALASTNNLSADITINTTPEYYVKVDACNGYGRCIESPEILISSIQPEQPTATLKPTSSPKPIITNKPSAKPSATPRVTVKPTIAPEKIATSTPEKIATPSSNDNKTQKERPSLQVQFSKIMSWIKSLFHF